MTHQAKLPGNAHLTPAVLRDRLAEVLDTLAQQVGEQVALERLGRLEELPDATMKVLVRSAAGRPVAVIICSSSAAPSLVARGAQMAEQIRDRIGKPLAEAIIRPIEQGVVHGCSYVVLPYCRDYSPYRLVRTAQRLRIQRPLLTWLREATAKAAKENGSGAVVYQSYASALEHLERQRLLDDEIQAAICHALKRLESGSWRPRHTFDHNDLHLGNIMLPMQSKLTTRSLFPFVLIDWVGANPNGFGIYDLVRFARAVNLSHKSLHRELMAHSEALQCEPQDSVGHLLAALGRLHQHLEHFPEQRFVATANACWQQVARHRLARSR